MRAALSSSSPSIGDRQRLESLATWLLTWARASYHHVDRSCRAPVRPHRSSTPGRYFSVRDPFAGGCLKFVRVKVSCRK